MVQERPRTLVQSALWFRSYGRARPRDCKLQLEQRTTQEYLPSFRLCALVSCFWSDLTLNVSLPGSSHLVACSLELSYIRPRTLHFQVDACSIRFLEHVQLETSLEYSLRGALQIHLTAPTGIFYEIYIYSNLLISHLATYLLNEVLSMSRTFFPY